MKTAVLATTRGIVLTFRAAPPNNQSLTRLVLSESSDVTADIANTDRPLLASCETVACRPRINLVKLPTRLARSRSLAPWIDKLPDPVFRRHVTLNVATSNTEEKCYGFTKCTRENQTNAPRLSLSLSLPILPSSSSFYPRFDEPTCKNQRLFSQIDFSHNRNSFDSILFDRLGFSPRTKRSDYCSNAYLRAVRRRKGKEKEGEIVDRICHYSEWYRMASILSRLGPPRPFSFSDPVSVPV